MNVARGTLFGRDFAQLTMVLGRGGVVRVPGAAGARNRGDGSAIAFGLSRLRRHRRGVMLLAVVLLGGTALQLVPGLLLRAYLDRVGAGGGPSAGSAVAAALSFVVVSLVVQLIGVVEGYLASWLAWTATNELRADVTRHVMDLDLSFHREHLPGELVQRIDGDIGQLGNFLSRFLISVVSQGLVLVGLGIGLTVIDWRIGVTLVPLSVVAFLVLRKVSIRGRDVQATFFGRRASFAGFVSERLGAVADLAGNGAVPWVNATVRVRADEVARLDVRRDIWGSIVLWAVTSFIAWLAAGTALWWSWELYTGGVITLGTAFLVFAYTQRMISPLDVLTSQNQDFQAASAAVVRVRELMATPARAEPVEPQELPEHSLAVEFRSVDFGYRPDQYVLKGIDLVVAPGRTLGIVGRTGSGKSTIARLLSKSYEPSAGAVLLGGVDLRRVRSDRLCEVLGVVPQEVQIFHASVRDNLTFFGPIEAGGDTTLWAALEQVGLRDRVAALPARLDTRVGAGGHELSTGEEQLLSLARVLLRDPRVVILDEASSRLDPVTERAVQQAAATLLTGRTSIVIAHRLSTLDAVDDILVLEHGQVVEHGQRDALASDPASRFNALLRAAAFTDDLDELTQSAMTDQGSW